MKNKLKNNTKIKIISLLSALVLWIYVMAVVDPDDTKLFEDVPVAVTNIDELSDNDLIVYPESDLVADIYITGRLSDLQKITAEDIHIYGTINNPMEGNNKLALKANITKQVSYEFKSDFIVVRLEKVIHEKKEIRSDITGRYKDDVDTIILDADSVNISGPRILIDQVKYIKASVSIDSNDKGNLTQRVKLVPVNNLGKEVKGVNLDIKSVNAEIRLLEEKEVPINLQVEDTSVDISNYEVTPQTVTIKGKKDIIDTITYINTKKADLSGINTLSKIELDIPEEITANSKQVSVKVKDTNSLLKRLIYSADEIELKNNYDNISIEELNIPDSINIEIELEDSSEIINKSDIKLYIDLSNGYKPGNKYTIEYTSDKNIKSINIIPSIVGE